MDYTQKNTRTIFCAIFLSFIVLLGAFFLYKWVDTYMSCLVLVSSAVTFVISILSWNSYRLQFRAELEAEEQKSIKQSVGASKELFDDSDEALMLSARSLKTWNKYILPTISIVAGLAGVYFFFISWLNWLAPVKVEQKIQMAAAACAGVLGVFCFLLGAYFGGVSKRKGGLGLRPFSAWAYFTAILSVVLMAVLFFYSTKYPDIDKIASRFTLAVLIILSLELALNFIIDLYRPRYHIEEKSILESRLLTTFTDSGSIASNIAHALDYQFGLKITEQSFYRFLYKIVLPLLVLQFLALYLLSCFTLIELGQRGLKEEFGNIDSSKELKPGLYLHLPYPMTKVHVYSADKISVVEVGQVAKPMEKSIMPESEEEQNAGNTSSVTTAPNIELWAKKGHHQEGMEEINYIVSANRLKNSKEDSTQVVNMITAIVPVHYRIKEYKEGEISPLYQFMFGYANGKEMVKTISSEVVMNYLTKSDYISFLGSDREKAAKELQSQIQKSLDDNNLGIEVVSVALESTHPPREVSMDYDDVMSAEYDKDNVSLNANLDKIKITTDATIKEKSIVSQALGETALIDYKDDSGNVEKMPMKLALAKERGFRLKAQNESYLYQPYLFSLINYLEVLERGLADTKLIIIDDEKVKTNFKFDFKPKIVPDFEGLELPTAK